MLHGGDDGTPAPTCPLCGAVACVPAVAALVEAASPAGGALAGNCDAADALALVLLRDQGAVVCRRSSGAPARAAGSLSLARLTQCSSCGVLACPRGHFCPGDAPPQICPAGFWCGGGAHKELCAAGSYCPERSDCALPCRGIASCPEGAYREVVWVPLFLFLLLCGGLQVGRAHARAALTQRTADVCTCEPAGGGGGGGSPEGAPGGGGGGGIPEGAPPRIGLVFRGLRLVTRGAVRMEGASGTIHAGRITAIMGGSGAGKTTLASLLLGKEAPTSGSVRADVRPPAGARAEAFAAFSAPLGALCGAVGFVPQADTMLRDLSVRQVLAHSAATRLPAAWPAARARARVERVLAAMGLAHCAQAVIGGEGARGLSGGEVKRTSIALELAAAPSLLLLDEPTTGLDAAGAYAAMQLLQRSARTEGTTVVCILHQPREAILGEWGRGGRGGCAREGRRCGKRAQRC